MANPITSRDLYQDTGELDRLITKLQTIGAAMAGIVARGEELREVLGGAKAGKGQQTTEALFAQKAAVDELAESYRKLKEAKQKTEQEIAEERRKAEVKRLKEATDALKKEATEAQKIQDAATKKAEAAERRSEKSRRALALYQEKEEQKRQQRAEKLKRDQEAEIKRIEQRNAKELEASRKRDEADKKREERARKAAQARDPLFQAYQRLNKAQDANALTTARINDEAGRLTRTTRLQAKELNAANSSYDQMSARLGIVVQQMHRMTAQQLLTTKSGRALTAEASNLKKRLDEIDQSWGNYRRNVGNYRGALGQLELGIRNLLAAYLGLQGLQVATSAFFRTAKELNSLAVANDVVFKSQERTARSTAFLSDISDRYGQNILVLNRSYLKFAASAQASNLSLQDTENIFRSFTKAVGILGLSSADAEGVFRALEQIISKGTLSSEELRLQLGDRLPGAFVLAAKALNVTTGELQKMLKQGQVVSNDFLPKFAVEVERAFGADSVKYIDSLAAAQGRFNRELVLLVQTADAAGVFKDFFDILRAGVKVVRENFKFFTDLTKAIIQLGVAYGIYSTFAIKSATDTTRLAKAVAALNVAVQRSPFTVMATAALGLYTILNFINDRFKKLNDTVSENTGVVKEATKNVIAEKNEYSRLLTLLRDTNTNYETKKSALEKLNGKYKDYHTNLLEEKSSYDEINKALAEGNALFDQRIKLVGFQAVITKQGDQLAEIGAAIVELEVERLAFQRELDRLQGRGPGGFTVTDTANPSTTAEAAKKAEIDALNASIDDNYRKQRLLQQQYDLTIELAKAQGIALADLFGLTTDTGGGDKPKVDLEKAFQDYLRYQRDLNQLREDGYEKEIKELGLFFEEQENMYKAHGLYLEEYLPALLDYYFRKRREIAKKYGQADLLAPTQPIPTIGPGAGQTDGVYIEPSTAKFIEEQYLADREVAERRLKLAGKTERELQIFKLETEAETLRKRLYYNAENGKELNDQERRRIQDLLKIVEAEINKARNNPEADGPRDIWTLLGLKLSDADKQLIADSTQYAVDQMNTIFQLQEQLHQEALRRADERVEAAQRELDAEIALQAAGYANRVESARRELALAKKQQEEAIKQQRKFQTAQLAVNTALEASNLVLAITKILSDPKLTFPLNLIAAGSMLAFFTGAKVKAFQLARKQTFGEGGFEIVGGGSHASGDDTPLGFAVDGKPAYAERGEAHAIIRRPMTQKYQKDIRDVTNAFNRGTFHREWVRLDKATAGIQVFAISGPQVNTRTMETHLRTLVKQGEREIITDGSGRRIERYKNCTTIWRN